MQYFATEIGRNQIHENIWIYSTISNVRTYLECSNRVAAITDLRFYGEAEAICKQDCITYIVKVNRPDKEESFNHISEQGDFDVDYIHMSTQSEIYDKINSLQAEAEDFMSEDEEDLKNGYVDIYYIFVIPFVVLLIIDYIYYRKKI